MKRYIFPLLMFVLLLGVNKTFAQAANNSGAKKTIANAQPGVHETAQNLTYNYSSKLKVTADQNKKMYGIFLSYAQAESDAKKSGNANASKANSKDLNTKLQAVLTNEQYQKFQSLPAPGTQSTK